MRKTKWKSDNRKHNFSRIPFKKCFVSFLLNGPFAFFNFKEDKSRAQCSKLILTTWIEKCRLKKAKSDSEKYFSFYNHSSSRGKVKRKNPFYVDTISKIPLFNLTMKESTAPAKRKQEKTFSILLGKPLLFIAITFYGHRCFVLISDRKVATDAPFL